MKIKKMFSVVAVSVMLASPLAVTAQNGGSDGLFNGYRSDGGGDNYRDYNSVSGSGNETMSNQTLPAPVGSGCLILTALGAAYLIRKKSRDNE